MAGGINPIPDCQMTWVFGLLASFISTVLRLVSFQKTLGVDRSVRRLHQTQQHGEERE